MNPSVLIGYSGHSLVVADAYIRSGRTINYYLDREEKDFNPLSITFIGDEKKPLKNIYGQNYSFLLAIGDNKLRRHVGVYIEQKGEKLENIIHPSASVSPYSEISKGVFINSNATINSMAQLKDGVIINTAAVIEHQCRIGSFAHIAPGAVLAGNVKVGDGSFIGANSVVKEGVSIGKNVVIGAGSIVLHDIEDNVKAVGCPVRIIK